MFIHEMFAIETTRSPMTDVLHGLIASSLVLILTVFLEMQCPEEVKKLFKKKAGGDLYKQAVLANLVNVLVFGTLTYWFTVGYVCHPGPLSLMARIRGAAGVVVVEGFLFYFVHKAFHEVKGLYWAHSFHHRFNEVVLPSTASAVSITEFVFAYMIPIIVGCAVVPNDRVSAIAGSAVISITNLLIHTPFMKGAKYHWFFVAPDDHFRHHRRITTDYGAPVISYDRLLSGGNT